MQQVTRFFEVGGGGRLALPGYVLTTEQIGSYIGSC